MKTVLNVKVDATTKKKAQRLAKDLGLSVSAMVNAYLKEVTKSKRVTYAAEPGYRMSPQLEAELAEVEEDIKAGRNIDGPFSTDEELDRYFDTPLKELEAADRKRSRPQKRGYRERQPVRARSARV